MGVVPTIGINKFPKQGGSIHARVSICFNYDPSKRIGGTIVRDDREHPYVTIFRLDDGRYVLATECQFSFRQG